MVVLRRKARKAPAIAAGGQDKQQQELFATVEVLEAGELYEYAVLVTSLEE